MNKKRKIKKEDLEEFYQDELERKDKIIHELKKENEILLRISIKQNNLVQEMKDLAEMVDKKRKRRK